MGVLPIGEALTDVGMGTIAEYITCRNNIVAQYIYMRPIFDISMAEDRRRIGGQDLRRPCTGGNRGAYGSLIRGEGQTG